MREFLISEPVLFIIVFTPLALVILGLVYYVFRLRKEVHDLKSPKYGFLGKSLASFVIFTFILGGYSLSIISNTSLVVPDVMVSDSVDITINTEVLGQEGLKYLVEFRVIPEIVGKQWGEEGDEFDVFWTITGEETLSEVELRISKSNQGSFRRELTSGTYSIQVNVFYNSTSYTQSTTLKVP